MTKPEGFEQVLGEFGPMISDGYCGETIMWGFKILQHLGEEKFEQLKKLGKVECCYPDWFFITKCISRQEAVEKYGSVTDEKFGPRGGWKSVTFGTKTFIHPLLKE